mmetsp:Transcript_9765/g.24706  ORF Transcript_9765/g.24706 Transcript_9765/m.24706 type:complete len:218 (+) Transcript_9765:655-1308(+)
MARRARRRRQARRCDLQGCRVQRNEGRLQQPRQRSRKGPAAGCVPRQHVRRRQRRRSEGNSQPHVRGVPGLPREVLPPHERAILVLRRRRSHEETRNPLRGARHLRQAHGHRIQGGSAEAVDRRAEAAAQEVRRRCRRRSGRVEELRRHAVAAERRQARSRHRARARLPRPPHAWHRVRTSAQEAPGLEAWRGAHRERHRGRAHAAGLLRGTQGCQG